MALLLTLPVEAALYPLASHLATFNAGDNFAPGYYAKPTIGRFIGAVFEVVGGGLLGSLLLLLSALLIRGSARFQKRSELRLPAAAEPGQTREVWVPSQLQIAIIALCLLPLITFAFSLFVTKSFSARYMVAGALLPAIAFPYVLEKLPSRRLVALGLVPLIVGILVVRSHAPDPIADTLAVLQEPTPAYPIVVGEGLLFIESWRRPTRAPSRGLYTSRDRVARLAPILRMRTKSYALPRSIRIIGSVSKMPSSQATSTFTCCIGQTNSPTRLRRFSSKKESWEILGMQDTASCSSDRCRDPGFAKRRPDR